MKRKIAAILAADVAGYSKLVAIDEEGTLRRLAEARAVFEDFIAKHGGRIFNTAGDSVMSEFTSSVEAVRCAIEVQESLRRANFEVPADRAIWFRMGVTVADVVERDGDLLGDGVNIAARLQELSEPGGVCVSHIVHDQVASKVAVRFADLGPRQVKNIPTPVQVFSIAGSVDAAGGARAGPAASSGSRSMTRTTMVAMAVLIGGMGWMALHFLAGWQWLDGLRSGGGTGAASDRVAPTERVALVPEQIPFISSRHQRVVRNEYMAAKDYKAIAINLVRVGMVSGKASEAEARREALAACTNATKGASLVVPCEVYAVGNTVVGARRRPPMPPLPWISRDATVETRVDPQRLPAIGSAKTLAVVRKAIAEHYLPDKRHKAIALSPSGRWTWYYNQETEDDAVRRTLQYCGDRAGLACRIVALGDVMVVSVPQRVTATGLFNPESSPQLAPEQREIVQRRLQNAPTGWSAVAAGKEGRAGIAVKAASEAAASEAALAECGRLDRDCRLIAVGPFTVSRAPPKPDATERKL